MSRVPSNDMYKSVDQGDTNVIQAQSGEASIRGVTAQIAPGYFSLRLSVVDTESRSRFRSSSEVLRCTFSQSGS
jgi:hypothetical protein